MRQFLFSLTLVFVTAYAQAEEDPWYKTAPSCVIDRGNPARTNEYKVAPLTQLHGHVTSNEELENNNTWSLVCGNKFWYVGQFTALAMDRRKIDTPIWQKWQAWQKWSFNSFVRPPAFYKGVLYYVNYYKTNDFVKNELVGLDEKTGNQISTLKLNKVINYFFIYNDVIYLSLEQEIAAYLLKTGKKIWSVPMPPARRYDNDPGPLATDGSLLYGGKNALYAIDLKTGKIKWKNKHASGYNFKFYKDKIIADGDINIIALDSITGKNIKQYKKYLELIAVTDGMILGYAGANIVALDLNTGKKIWEIPGGIFNDTDAIAGEVLYFLDYAHKLHAVNKFTGKEFWSYQLIDDNALPANRNNPAILPVDHGLLVGDLNGYLQILY